MIFCGPSAVLGGTFAACLPGYSQIGDKCYTVWNGTFFFFFSGKNYEFEFLKIYKQVPGLPQRFNFWSSNELCSVARGDLFHVQNITQWEDLNTFLVGLGIVTSSLPKLYHRVLLFISLLNNQVTTTPTGPELLPRDTPVSGLLGRPDSSWSRKLLNSKQDLPATRLPTCAWPSSTRPILDVTSGSTTPAATSTSSCANTELAIKYLFKIFQR